MPVENSLIRSKANLLKELHDGAMNTCLCPDRIGPQRGYPPVDFLAHLSDGSNPKCNCQSGDIFLLIQNQRQDYGIDVIVDLEIDPTQWDCEDQGNPIRAKIVSIPNPASGLFTQGQIEKIKQYAEEKGEVLSKSHIHDHINEGVLNFWKPRVKRNEPKEETENVKVSIAYEIIEDVNKVRKNALEAALKKAQTVRRQKPFIDHRNDADGSGLVQSFLSEKVR